MKTWQALTLAATCTFIAACSSPDGGASPDPGAAGSGGSGGGPAPGDKCSLFVLDDFEDPRTYQLWTTINDGTGTQTPVAGTSLTPEKNAETGSLALHTSGSGFTDFGASVGFDVGITQFCGTSLEGTKGIKFRAKGSPKLNLLATVPVVIPEAQGGTCKQGCWDAPMKTITLSSNWSEYQVLWDDLKQEGFGTIVSNLAPKDFWGIRFAVTKDMMPFDFWLDDIAGIPGESGGACVPATDVLLSECEFDAMFPSRNSFYTYASFMESLKAWPKFASSSDRSVNRKEVAAFLANVAHETGKLKFIEETNPTHIYCQASGQYPCAPGKSYHGRGPLQISWNYNYGRASEELGLGQSLLNEPEQAAKNAALAWELSLWFWMTAGCHEAIVGGSGFGRTIQIINGSECGGGAPDQIDQRVLFYETFAKLLGVDPGGNLRC